MNRALVADTGGLLRALARKESGQPSWPEYEAALRAARAVIVPALVLVEVDYFLRAERAAMRALVADIFSPQSRYELDLPSPADFVRALHIDAKFAELKLGLVDGLVAATAERRGIYRVLTTDRRDFAPLRLGSRWNRVLTLVPASYS